MRHRSSRSSSSQRRVSPPFSPGSPLMHRGRGGGTDALRAVQCAVAVAMLRAACGVRATPSRKTRRRSWSSAQPECSWRSAQPECRHREQQMLPEEQRQPRVQRPISKPHRCTGKACAGCSAWRGEGCDPPRLARASRAALRCVRWDERGVRGLASPAATLPREADRARGEHVPGHVRGFSW